MRIAVIGGGPAGLYLAIQMMKADPSHEITIYERNPRGSTFGWGVVFSDDTLDNFRIADAKTFGQITEALAHWDDIHVYFGGKVIKSGGHGFSGIARWTLLEILTNRAQELGTEIVFEEEVGDEEDRFADTDVIIAADGINSMIRRKYAKQFRPDLDVRCCKFVWLGTRRLFDAFTFFFEETEHGWYQAHCYRFDKDYSTFIVECPEEVWRKEGFNHWSKEEAIQFCEKLFAPYLEGHRLISNAAHLRGSDVWLNFHRVSCEKWHYKNIVLLGDAAATAHFSVGSGTKLAMESAIALAQKLHEHNDLETALASYEEERRLEVLRLQNAARNSTEWFEQVGLKAKLEPEQFAYSLITRSQRVSHENLRIRDKEYLENYERWFAFTSTGKKYESMIPPMFLPFRLREMEVRNRIACSPMAMYSAVDGTVGDFHLVHFGTRALGGAGLIFTEMTCVSPDARITPGCAGMYTDEHVHAWKKVVDFVHQHSEAKFGMQLGHAGRKGSTKLGWEGMDEPLDHDNWPLYAPSPLGYGPQNQVPKEMTREDMSRVRDQFVAATHRAEAAGFDMLELHCAHGYLLSNFISPITNHRTDDYGGALENRLRFPVQVFAAMRAVWPEHKPMSVRISATDWVPGGTSLYEAIETARILKEQEVDSMDVSTGQVSRDQKPVYGRMYQVPFSERIRLEVGISTMAVGNIYEPDHANGIIASGRADLCLLARPHLWDPYWTLRAAAQLGYEDVNWPDQYLSGQDQFELLCRRARDMQAMGPI